MNYKHFPLLVHIIGKRREVLENKIAFHLTFVDFRIKYIVIGSPTPLRSNA